MLDIFTPKTRVQFFDIQELPIESCEIMGINQINPYYRIKTEKQEFITIVTIANDSRKYDEKEAYVLSDYFVVKKCPKCKSVTLIPTKMKINQSHDYLKNEEEIAFGDYFDSRYNFPTRIEAYCNNCSSCFNILVKNKEPWVKEAKKLKSKDIIGGKWETYQVD